MLLKNVSNATISRRTGRSILALVAALLAATSTRNEKEVILKGIYTPKDKARDQPRLIVEVLRDDAGVSIRVYKTYKQELEQLEKELVDNIDNNDLEKYVYYQELLYRFVIPA